MNQETKKKMTKAVWWIAMLTYVSSIGMLLWLLICSTGCATGYATLMRAEHFEGKETVDKNEYPKVYPATSVVIGREFPTWVYISGWEEIEWYSPIMWPIGFVGTMSDLCISAVTDSLAMPYDVYQATKTSEPKKGDE